MKPLVIYHGNCQDGFTAAWACWMAHPDWEYYPAKHGDAPPDVLNRDVYMLDFSYKRPVIEDIMMKAKSLVILDHHKTAQEDLKGPFACDPAGTADVRIIFDMDKSGARLAWEYFHGGSQATVPQFVRFVEDRDLWRFDFPETKAFTAALFAEDYDFETWTSWYRNTKMSYSGTDWDAIEDYVLTGEAILKKQAKDINELLSNKFRINIQGHNVWTCNLPYIFASDAASLLAEGEEFASTYYFDGKKYVFSLRSTQTGADVSEIAKQFPGGGGHKHAAGFQVPHEVFMSFLKGEHGHFIQELSGTSTNDSNLPKSGKQSSLPRLGIGR